MNTMTKSCSTYLSANPLQRGHCVRRTPLPSARSSALEYVVYSVLTGNRHSMQIGIVLAATLRVGVFVRRCLHVWCRSRKMSEIEFVLRGCRVVEVVTFVWLLVATSVSVLTDVLNPQSRVASNRINTGWY